MRFGLHVHANPAAIAGCSGVPSGTSISSSMFRQTSMSESTSTTRSYSVSSNARNLVQTLVKRANAMASCISCASTHVANIHLPPLNAAHGAAEPGEQGPRRRIDLLRNHYHEGVSRSVARQAVHEYGKAGQVAFIGEQRGPARVLSSQHAVGCGAPAGSPRLGPLMHRRSDRPGAPKFL